MSSGKAERSPAKKRLDAALIDELLDDEGPDLSDFDDETAFDDVAMILLLFFMVMYPLVVISPEAEGPKRAVPETAKPVKMEDVYRGVTHRLLITEGRTGGIQLQLTGIGRAKGDPPITRRGPYLKSGSNNLVDEMDAFKNAFKGLMSEPMSVPDGAPKPVYLVVHLDHETNNDTVLTTWWALSQLRKDKDLEPYTKKIGFTRWRSQIQR